MERRTKRDIRRAFGADAIREMADTIATVNTIVTFLQRGFAGCFSGDDDLERSPWSAALRCLSREITMQISGTCPALSTPRKPAKGGKKSGKR
jgi:hypothetical protein